VLYLYRIDSKSQTPYMLKSGNGVFKAPVGKYRLLGYDSPVTGRREPIVSGRYRNPPVIAVTDGSTYRLKAGPPLVASIAVSQTGRNYVTMDLRLTGRGGEQCMISTKEPRFQVLSKAGRVLQEGKFKYG